jgi:hypothetical protein
VYLTDAGRHAVFPSLSQVRGIDRVYPPGDEGRRGNFNQKRLDRRMDVALDALQDLRDVRTWSDADVTAMHNTINRAAVTAKGANTDGLAWSMPLPMVLAWAGRGDVQRDPDRCRCRGCTNSNPIML